MKNHEKSEKLSHEKPKLAQGEKLRDQSIAVAVRLSTNIIKFSFDANGKLIIHEWWRESIRM
jgi:hypothetical protein